MKRPGRYPAHRLVLLWVTLMGLALSPPLWAKPPPIAILYPQVGKPYRGIFLQIIEGIESRLSRPALPVSLESGFAVKHLKQQLNAQGVAIVIALGSRGLLAAKALQSGFTVVVGAVLMVPDEAGLTGIALTPDPKRLFRQLKLLVPAIQSVTVIYGQAYSEGLIARARAAARAHNIELKALPAKDTQQAALLYRHVLGRLKSATEALWLLHGRLIDEQALLPLILHRAWDRELVVFSSNLAYVKRGALFTLYPNNVAMGRNLAALALAQAGGVGPAGVRPLRALQSAINVRTAKHLGLHLPYWRLQTFELVFPSR